MKLIEFINWVRLYNYADGMSIFRSLRKATKSFFKVNASFFPQPVILRNNYSDRAIFLQVFYEKQYDLYDQQLPAAQTIIDAGANIGLASIYFSIKFPNAEIVAVEPEKENFKLLKKNTNSYNNIDPMQAGIWDKNEAIRITNPETLAAGFMVEANNKSDESINGITIRNIMETKNWKNIDILKMDIEGAEKEVFSANDMEWLSKVKVLIIELHDRYKPETTKVFFKALNNFNYDAYFHHENIFIFFK